MHREEREQPDDPFTLFNLGSIYHEQGRYADALPCLRRSLERSRPNDSIVRKLHALLVSCHRGLGQQAEAWAACQEGLRVCPDDTELLFVRSLLLKERGDRAAAKAGLLQLLTTEPPQHFASIDAGLRGYKARHNLAILHIEEGLLAEAEKEWRLAVADRAEFVPAWLGLGDVHLRRGEWEALASIARRLDSLPDGAVEAAVLRARGHLARREFTTARQLLEESIARWPRALGPRIILSHVLLQEGQDLIAAAKALRAILELAPDHAEARHNLAVLLQHHGHDLPLRDNRSVAALYEHACTTPSDINEHLPTLYALAKECRHVTEMGTRTGVSTTALLYARPDKLVCYDRIKYPEVDRLAALAAPTEFIFHQQDVLSVEIEPTDLLFLDTWHVYEQLRDELRRHASKVRKYIVLHDTTTFGEQGETAGYRGLWPAVEEFLAEGTFRLQARYENNNGLTVLEAVC